MAPPRTQEPAAIGWFTASYFNASAAPGSDTTEFIATGGVVVRIGDMEFRAASAVLSLDRDELNRRFSQGDTESQSGLPDRGLTPLPSKRRNGNALIRKRMAALLRAAGGQPDRMLADPIQGEGTEFPVEGVRHLYLEGNVTLIRLGREVLHASSVSLSPLDDRMVLRNATIRLESAGRTGPRIFTVRGPEFVRQGTRFTGRDATITSDPAGDPELDLEVGLLEVIQRGDEFELVTRDSVLRIQEFPLIPLPRTRMFTGSQQPFLLQGVTGGYSNREGTSVRVDLGGSINESGGAVHNALTGRPAGDFRGDWRMGFGFIEKRGAPLSPELEFRATTEDGRPLYEGRMEGFFLEDQGGDFRRITRRLDGSLASDGTRSRVFTETRLFLDRDTTLDLTYHRLSDEAVYSEFFEPRYLQDEEPETSLVFRSASDNRLLLARGRWNLNRFSYGDSRNLANGFVEEVPRISFDMFEQPLLETPWDRPLTLTSRSEFAILRTNTDGLLPDPLDETTRVDQLLELSTAFNLGPVTFRPFSNARFTWYDRTDGDRSGDRWAFATGIQAGSRFQRVFSWLDDAGKTQKLRHVISPQVTFQHVYQVDGEPMQFASFDRTDALTEQALTRFTLLNRLQRMNPETGMPEDVVWLDLVQNVFPISDRDNAGDGLGLLEYEFIARPMAGLGPLPGLELLVEGEHDWNTGRYRTFNSRLSVGPIGGINWFGGYRSDAINDGQVDFGGFTRVRDRWTILSAAQYDLEGREFLSFLGRLSRRDRNWEIALAVNYDQVADEVRLRIDFTPLLLGLGGANPYGFQGSSDVWGPGSRY